MPVFLAHFLFVLAAWTVVIKYVFPVGYAVAHGLAPGTHVYLDLWPVPTSGSAGRCSPARGTPMHSRSSWLSSRSVSCRRNSSWFLDEPQWTIWTTNWFVNKLFVLGCFVLMLGHLLVRRRDYRPPMEAIRLRGAAPS